VLTRLRIAMVLGSTCGAAIGTAPRQPLDSNFLN